MAGHLKYLFDRFEPPLFCKRDSGGNLNHLAVNQVLEETLVIPINSPPQMALYNGVIEQQWLVKNGLIKIQKSEKVYPNFCQKMDHN